jgi:nucleoid DNA-binding protein
LEKIMLNKASLMQKMSKTTRLPLREASAYIDVIFDAMADAISRGERIELRGFGSFDVRQIAARRTALANGAVVPPHGRIVFRPCQKLRESVWNKTN